MILAKQRCSKSVKNALAGYVMIKIILIMRHT